MFGLCSQAWCWCGGCAAILVGAVGVLVTGCSRKGTVTGVEIIRDPTQVEAARAAWRESQRTWFEGMLAAPAKVRSYESEDVRKLRMRRDEVVRAYTAIRDDVRRSADERLSAIIALNFFEVSPEPGLTSELLARADSAAFDFLFSFRELYPPPAPVPDVIRREVVRWVDRDDIRMVGLAGQIAAERGFVEAAESIRRRAVTAEPAHLGDGLRNNYATLRPSATLLVELMARLHPAQLIEGTPGLDAIVALGKSAPDVELRRGAAEVCVDYLTAQEDQRWIGGGVWSAIELVGTVEPADQATLLLTRLVEKARWQLVRTEALRVLGKQAPRAAAELARRCGMELESSTERGAKSGARVVTAAEAEQVGVAAGWFSAVEARAARERMERDRKSGKDPESPAAPDVFSFLHGARRVVFFDVETGRVPNLHDRLVQDFAEASAGRFAPEAVSEEYTPNPGDPATGTYVLQFVHAERLYRVAPRDLGDWYDVETVLKAIHAALADVGVAERFVALETGDQTALLVFGDPTAVAKAAPKLLLKLEADLDRSWKLGVAYEEKVRESLK